MSTRIYQLHVYIDSRWVWVCDIVATDHAEAFRKAVSCMKPEHYDKRIRVEQLDLPEEKRPSQYHHDQPGTDTKPSTPKPGPQPKPK